MMLMRASLSRSLLPCCSRPALSAASRSHLSAMLLHRAALHFSTPSPSSAADIFASPPSVNHSKRDPRNPAGPSRRSAADRASLKPAPVAPTPVAPTHFVADPVPVVTESSPAEPDAPSPNQHRFSDYPLSAPTSRALRAVFKFDSPSSVQHEVLSRLPVQTDLLVRAKTGTGKTLAFLIAAIESLLSKLGISEFPRDVRTRMNNSNNNRSRNQQKFFDGDAARQGTNSTSQQTPDVKIVVLSPTRELANQIATEATRLVSFHNLKVITLVGGESRNRQMMDMERNRADIIVATPGRIIDFLESSQKIADRFSQINVLILDEADQLLEMGFKDSIDKIVSYLPTQRQTFMFSATLEPAIRAIASRALRPDHLIIDTVPKNEVATHLHVQQSYLVPTLSNHLQTLHGVLKSHVAARPDEHKKIIVFLPTTVLTSFYAELFTRAGVGLDVLEIHSRLTQNQRTRVSSVFRRSRAAVLFTSDVSARGVDYPDVTLVVQVFATTREQYIHRVGRTGRAGKKGEGVLLLSPYEKHFLEELQGLPVREGSVDADAYRKEFEDKIGPVLNMLGEDAAGDLHVSILGYREFLNSTTYLLQHKPTALTHCVCVFFSSPQ
ncbi:P-loop containing nucleoside triphosphate hydrolase protein [Cladochytrium replicatum]|nr:P-loop containing nucleoside triphosphate hydrolase protein [Cladochytrium replicatum]